MKVEWLGLEQTLAIYEAALSKATFFTPLKGMIPQGMVTRTNSSSSLSFSSAPVVEFYLHSGACSQRRVVYGLLVQCKEIDVAYLLAFGDRGIKDFGWNMLFLKTG